MDSGIRIHRDHEGKAEKSSGALPCWMLIKTTTITAMAKQLGPRAAMTVALMNESPQSQTMTNAQGSNLDLMESDAT